VAGTTYYFQAIDASDSGGYLYFSLDVAPPPSVSFYTSHYEPSIFDTIAFYSSAWDPANQAIQSWHWDLGDGSTSTEPSVSHRYAADGDYTVVHTVTTSDGRSGSYSSVLLVRTHDIAVTKIARPQSATVGQTKRLIISVTNTRYPEDVTVELYKSVPGGYQSIGFLRQFVDVKAKNKPTNFTLSYTFTQEDAQVGKVIFKAIANPANARDAFPADNEFISFAVKVKAKKAGIATSADEAVTSAALDDMSDYATDDISNVEETLDVAATADDDAVGETSMETTATAEAVSGERAFISYLPLISGQ
jgi:PKD repeat protein